MKDSYPIRLDKLVAHCSGLPRSQVKKWIKKGTVWVNDAPEKNAARHITIDDEVLFEGNTLEIRGPQYYMLHKPESYVCANKDPHNPVVFELLWGIDLRDLHTVGRLDIDTTGLILITDDGQWSHRITSPKHICEKVYRVTVDKPLKPQLVSTFEKGLMLEGEKHRTQPSKLTIDDETHATVILTEGRYHQVKRMFHACGYEVVALHRDRIGAIELDTALEEGDYRPLTAAEIESVR